MVQKAKKAKDKLLKRDGDDRPDTGSYESFYYGGVDPYMWEPQELGETAKPVICSTANQQYLLMQDTKKIFFFCFLGVTRSHLDLFKKHRAARIDHYVIEVNKLIIRLEKVCLHYLIQTIYFLLLLEINLQLIYHKL